MNAPTKRMGERLLSRYLYRFTPHGFNVFCDIRKRVPRLKPTVVADVGANVGQSALRFLGNFRGATVHCFEPFRETFATLSDRFRREPRVQCHQVALGDTPGQMQVALHGSSVENSLTNAVAHGDGGPAETVRVETLDRFCDDHSIDRIDYLKVDVEGFEREVLIGSARLLSEHRVSFVQLEAGMGPANKKHVPLRDLSAIMEGHGYALFGLYDQQPEWTGQPRLRFANPVYVSERAIKQSI